MIKNMLFFHKHLTSQVFVEEKHVFNHPIFLDTAALLLSVATTVRSTTWLPSLHLTQVFQGMYVWRETFRANIRR